MRVFANNEKIDLKPVNDDFNQSIKYGIDFISNYNNNILRMPKSTCYIQPWAPISSTEFRMVIMKKDIKKIIKYDNNKIEDKFLYYNTIDRSLVYHDNPNANQKLGFCHCNDCALENKIWEEYGYDKKKD